MDFGFHRGSLALDFAGTVGMRASAPQERIPGRAEYARWLRAAGLLARGIAVNDGDVTHAHALREAIVRVGAAVAADRRPNASDVTLVNRFAARDARPSLDPVTGRAAKRTIPTPDAALARIAADAVEVFGERADRLVRCALPECGALLLSETRGPRRRWCSMGACGNVAKARKHRKRLAGAPGAHEP